MPLRILFHLRAASGNHSGRSTRGFPLRHRRDVEHSAREDSPDQAAEAVVFAVLLRLLGRSVGGRWTTGLTAAGRPPAGRSGARRSTAWWAAPTRPSPTSPTIPGRVLAPVPEWPVPSQETTSCNGAQRGHDAAADQEEVPARRGRWGGFGHGGKRRRGGRGRSSYRAALLAHPAHDHLAPQIVGNIIMGFTIGAIEANRHAGHSSRGVAPRSGKQGRVGTIYLLEV